MGRNVKEAREERKIKTSLLDTLGLRYWWNVQVDVSRWQARHSLDIMDEPWNLGKGTETMQLSLGMGALRPRWGRTTCAAAWSACVWSVCGITGILLSTGASPQPYPAGLILPSLQRRKLIHRSAKSKARTQLGSAGYPTPTPVRGFPTWWCLVSRAEMGLLVS